MKKLLLIGISVVGIGVLIGCSGYETGENVQNGDFEAIGDLSRYDVIRDRETGCVYLEPHSSMGLTPLYDENGEVQGCGDEDYDFD